ISATINLEALRHNLRVVEASAPHSRIMAVVKANGYGHGLLNVARGLQEADGFAVLNLEEAIALREAGYQQNLLLLEGVFSADELDLVSRHNISVVVHNMRQIEMLEQAQLANPIQVFAKMHTGMNRLGFAPAAFASSVQRLAACRNVAEITLMTHFATADEQQGIEKPYSVFNQAAEGLEYPRSLANSAAVLRYRHCHAHWVRP